MNNRTGLSLLWIVLAAAHLNAQEIAVLSVGETSTEQGSGKVKDAVRSFAFSGPNSISLNGVDPNNATALFNMLSNESVRRELKLTDQQFSSAAEIMQASSRRISELVKANISEGKAFKINGLRELTEELRQEAEGAIEEILLPEQLKRLKQLAYQIDMARSGLTETVVHGKLGQEIGIVEGQKTPLEERAQKIEAKVQAEIARIRQVAREEFLKELNAEQRQKAQQLIGDYFDYQEPSLAQSIKQKLRKSLMDGQRANDRK